MKRPTFWRARQLVHLVLVCVVTLLLTVRCEQDFGGHYDPPKGMAGPIYEQLKTDPDFSEFVKALDKAPVLKRAINTSGLYTVFAPTNAAFTEYFKTSPNGKSSIEDFNMSIEQDSIALMKLLDSHILLDMYFEYDFEKFVSEEKYMGYNDGNDRYRFWTRYKDPKYWYYDNRYEKERLVRPSYKQLSIYTDKYLERLNITGDYEEYYATTAGDFNVEDAQVLADKRDIPAKNGAIHGINKVLRVKPFVDEVLQEKSEYFFKLFEEFVHLDYREDYTLGEATNELNPDSVFIKKYQMGFDLGSDAEEGTIFCPNEAQFTSFIENEILPGYYGMFDSIPLEVRTSIISTYMVFEKQWQSSIDLGLRNANGDTLMNLPISEKVLASNGAVYVVDGVIRNPLFESVTKVPFTHHDFTWMQKLISERDLKKYLRNEYKKFTVLMPTNQALKRSNIEYKEDMRGVLSFYKDGLKMLKRQKDSLLNYLIFNDRIINPEELQDYSYNLTRSGAYINFDQGAFNGSMQYRELVNTSNGNVYVMEHLPPMPYRTVASLIENSEEDSVTNVVMKSFPEYKIENALKSFDNNEAFTLFLPSKASFKAAQEELGWGEFHEDERWADVVEYMIITTRVFTDGTFQRKIDNPNPDNDSRFISRYRKVIYDEENIFEDDVHAWMDLDFENQTITTEAGDVANIIQRYDLQGKNGVIHHIDKVLIPPVRVYPDEEEE